jgi:ACT domain-containing protein
VGYGDSGEGGRQKIMIDKDKLADCLKDILDSTFDRHCAMSGFHQRVSLRAKADIEMAIQSIRDGDIEVEDIIALTLTHALILGAQSLEAQESLK